MTFVDALGGIYSQNAFPSPMFWINPFSYKSKTTSSERKNVFSKGIFIQNLAFPSLVSHAILRNAH